MGWLHQLFSSGHFMPHGYCYLWDAPLVWLHVVSDSLIALAYFSIPVVLVWFARKRKDLPFSGMFVLFGVFIVACGSTHLMEVWNLWHANYWLAGLLKAVTAAASVPTAILLARLAPRAVDLPGLQQWIRANAALQGELQERRDLELDLRVSEANFREQAELLDLTHDAIFVRDMASRVVYWNRASERLYGWTREQAQGRVTHELLQTKFPQPLSEIEEAVLSTGSWVGELVHTKKDGTEVTVSTRWALRMGSQGEPRAILESNRDITESKRTESKFRALLESAPDAIVIANTTGYIEIVNARTEAVFGYKREELVGRPVEILVPERVRDAHVVHRFDYAESPRPRAMGEGLELFGRRKDGTEFPVEISLAPLRTGQELLISSAIRDVTERKRANAKIQELNSELNRKLKELTAVNAELESFSYSVSHDLRAPLRHIDGFARILQDDHGVELSLEGKRHLSRILGAVKQMGQLVDDLLNLAKIGRRGMAKQVVSLQETVRQAWDEFGDDVKNRPTELRLGSLPQTECDPGLIKLVFSNLFGNALKFTRDRNPAVVEVGSIRIDGEVAIFVRDNGVGFDPQYADKLFGVFQRLHRQEDFEGTGIGLATVQRIVLRHGGRVWAESSLGQGATFFFTLGGSAAAPVPQEAHRDGRHND